MKVRYLALLLIGILPLMAFNCIVDDATIALNIPFNGTFNIIGGPNPNYSGTKTIDPATLYDQGYALTGAAVYDITVATSGPNNLGLITNGRVTVNGILLFTYGGTWNDYATPQSLLRNRTLITRNAAGVTELINAVVTGRTIVFAGSGTIATPPPSGVNTSAVTITAFVQAYGHLK